MTDRDRKAADYWMRDHLPDPDHFSLEDNEEEGDTQKYFFLRYRDSAMVVYLVAIKNGNVKSVKKEAYREFDDEKPEAEEWIVMPKGERRKRQRECQGESDPD